MRKNKLIELIKLITVIAFIGIQIGFYIVTLMYILVL